MTAALAFNPDDWRGRGDWDDMDVPVDPAERAYLARLEKDRLTREAREPKRPPNEWPQAEIDLLISMWKEGATAQKISDALGNRSRSAVMGRIDRMTRAGDLHRDDIHNRQNMTAAAAKMPKGRNSRKGKGWAQGNHHLFKGAPLKREVSRRGRRTMPEEMPKSAEVVFLRLPDLLDETFDTIETGWGNRFAEFQMAA